MSSIVVGYSVPASGSPPDDWQYNDQNVPSGNCSRLLFALKETKIPCTDVHTFPLFWSSDSRDRRRDILFPLYWHFVDRSADSAFTLLGPLYWSHHGARRTYGLLPLAWFSRDPAAREHSVALMPVFYQRSGPNVSSFYTLLAGYHRRESSSFWYAGTTAPPPRETLTGFTQARGRF